MDDLFDELPNFTEVLEDIRRTVQTFEDYYLDDRSKDDTRPGYDGYFSHLDYVTLRPDIESLEHNQSRKKIGRAHV